MYHCDVRCAMCEWRDKAMVEKEEEVEVEGIGKGLRMRMLERVRAVESSDLRGLTAEERDEVMRYMGCYSPPI